MADTSKILDAFRQIDKVLGFLECDRPVHDSEVHKLIETRNQARLDHDWALADSIRDQLEARGVVVQDNKIE